MFSGDFGEKAVFLIITMPLFMVSIAAHELAHGWVANRCGDPTAKLAGRLTLNPMAHIDPLGMLVFVLTALGGVGFGWAKPVPVNPLLFRNPRKDIIKVSLAGVGANLALVVFSIVAIKLLITIGFFKMHGGLYGDSVLADWMLRIMLWMMFFNSVLIVFNLIPIPPLDGSKVVMMLLPPDSARAFARIEPYGMMIVFLLIFAGVISKIISFFVGIVWNVAVVILSL